MQKPEYILIEREIIEQCRKGDLKNFRKLVDKASPFAYSLAFRMTGDEDESREIAQVSMITIWEKIATLRSYETFNTWLYRIVLNRCYDHLRRKKNNPEFRPDDAMWIEISAKMSHNPGTALENSEIREMLNTLTGRLSPKQKAVFILTDIEEMPADQVSQITGMSRVNIKANLWMARKRMGEMVEKYIK